MIKVVAEHNCPNATNRKPDEFNDFRHAVHLVQGAPVMLIVNKLWDLRTAKLGLMNGARGTVVGIVYDEDAAPPSLPAYVVVDFPEYRGQSIFDGAGREQGAGPACGDVLVQG